jgi:hypothetical protein
MLQRSWMTTLGSLILIVLGLFSIRFALPQTTCAARRCLFVPVVLQEPSSQQSVALQGSAPQPQVAGVAVARKSTDPTSNACDDGQCVFFPFVLQETPPSP